MHSCFLALLSLVSLVTAFDKQPYHKNTCGFTVMGYVENNYLLFFIAFFFHLSHRKKKKHSYLGKAPRSLRPQSWICWALVRIRLFSFCVLADSGDSQLPWEDWGLGLVFVSTSLGLSSAALPVLNITLRKCSLDVFQSSISVSWPRAWPWCPQCDLLSGILNSLLSLWMSPS